MVYLASVIAVTYALQLDSPEKKTECDTKSTTTAFLEPKETSGKLGKHVDYAIYLLHCKRGGSPKERVPGEAGSYHPDSGLAGQRLAVVAAHLLRADGHPLSAPSGPGR